MGRNLDELVSIEPIKPIQIGPKERREATHFLNAALVVAVKDFRRLIHGRFESIYRLLLEENINSHDWSHQLRVTQNAVALMQALDQTEGLFFDHREKAIIGLAALVHDFGYVYKRPFDPNQDGYLSGKKSQFMSHGLYGKQDMEFLFKLLNSEHAKGWASEEILDQWRSLFKYRDSEGGVIAFVQGDAFFMGESIESHNDYGGHAPYSPEPLNRASFALQIADKLDHCRARVYPQHMSDSSVFPDAEGNLGSDKKYVHRTVSYAIDRYRFELDPSGGNMTVVYDVDLDKVNQKLKSIDSGFRYHRENFMSDFKTAYKKSFKVAAEGVAYLLKRENKNEPCLNVVVNFGDEQVSLNFSPPDRGNLTNSKIAAQ